MVLFRTLTSPGPISVTETCHGHLSDINLSNNIRREAQSVINSPYVVPMRDNPLSISYIFENPFCTNNIDIVKTRQQCPHVIANKVSQFVL